MKVLTKKRVMKVKERNKIMIQMVIAIIGVVGGLLGEIAFIQFETLFGSTVGAIIGSSVLFGLFHFMGGNIGQIILTGFMGTIFCLCRVKIKNCTMFSLIIAHGVYDALTTVWLNIFT